MFWLISYRLQSITEGSRSLAAENEAHRQWLLPALSLLAGSATFYNPDDTIDSGMDPATSISN